MWKVIVNTILISILLSGSQIFLKLAVGKILPFAWTRRFWASIVLNWQLGVSGLCIGSATLLWLWCLKKYPLSVVYPLLSLSYVIGIIAGMSVFHETVGALKWVGVVFIIIGCLLIAK